VNDTNPKNTEDLALDALIVVALRDVSADYGTEKVLEGAERALTEEDRAALDRFGPEFVSDVMSGGLAGQVDRQGVGATDDAIELELETAMARGTENDDLPEEVRAEMERRLRDAKELGDEDEESTSGEDE